MGWDFAPMWRTKKEIVAELTEDEERVVRFQVIGSTLWTIEDAGHDELMICVYLLARSRRLHCWGFKAMSEQVGPFYYDCPLEFIDLVPVVNTAWREKVRRYWAQRPEPTSSPKQGGDR